MNRALLVCLVAAFVLLPVVSARDIWVDNSCPPGGNGNTEVCGPNGPFHDLHNALAIVQPGDTVLIRNGTGTYITNNLGGSPSVSGGFHMDVSGGGVITVTSAPGHFPLIANCVANDYDFYCPNPTFSTRTGTGASATHFVFDRVHVQGGIIFRGPGSVLNSRISKGYEPEGDGNLGAIKYIPPVLFQYSGVIRNNYFHDLHEPRGASFATRTWIYTVSVGELLMEYNTFEGYELDLGFGAFVDKYGESHDITFRYNWVINGRGGIWGMNTRMNAYGNVIICGEEPDPHDPGFARGTGTGLEMTGGRIAHNTIAYCRAGYFVHREDPRRPELLGTRDTRMYNNVYNLLYAANQRRWDFPPDLGLTPADFFAADEFIDFNVYDPGRLFYWAAPSGLSWNQWRNGIAADFGFDQNSAEIACEFLDPENFDFRLAPGSACTTFGRVNADPSGAVVEAGAFGVTDCVGHLCSPGSGFVPYDSSWRTAASSGVPSRPGDFTGDGEIGLSDLLYVVNRLGRVAGDPLFDVRADMNGDGIIDLFDLVLVAREFGT